MKYEYHKISSYEAKQGEFNKCLLLYSGGLDTSVILKWIQDNYHCEVVTLTIDIGQVKDDLEMIKNKAIKLGAKEAIIYDAKKEFADKILSQAIKANADYQGGYALSTPLGRVIISEIAVKVAKEYGCEVVAHGCTGKGNDQVRFESYIMTLDPTLKIIAPVREWSMGRDEQIQYAIDNDIPVKQKIGSPYSHDENMWGNTNEGGEIEDPKLIPPLENILQWCALPENSPNESEIIEIDFLEGIPIAINGEKMELASIVAFANKIGAKHSAGLFSLIEDRIVGLKVRGIYENPGATILIAAHKKLEQLVSTRDENEFKEIVDHKWAYLTYGAKWFEPVMSHLHAFINDHNKKVTGKVQVKLFKGNATVVSLSSPHSLFNKDLATFDKNAAFNQNASAGFIEIWSLAQKTAHKVFKY